ncbi:MAG: RNA polymerase sigma factor FliA [Nitrospirales bacterium]|nr:MAG: RNA polymerase sigma factor FliA [Nitrospirales bacterium]
MAKHSQHRNRQDCTPPSDVPVDASETVCSSVSSQDPAEILKEFFPMIRRIAGSLASRNPASLDIEDLTSAGVIGLLGALTRYDPNRETKFWTFAEYRIRGMMLDEIRAMDWIPRSVRARNDQIRHVSLEFMQKEGRYPTRDEVAVLLGVTQQELDATSLHDTRLLSLDVPMGAHDEIFTLKDVLPDEEQVDPYTACLSSESSCALDRAMERLTSRQQDVVQQYYFQGYTMKEIGIRLGLTESGICRIHSEALRKLRLRLKDFEGNPSDKPKNSSSKKGRVRKQPGVHAKRARV